VSILENPALRNLKPETKRERYLYFKAYVEGFEAALRSVTHFGLEEAQVIHQHAMANVKLPESMTQDE
jgi:hypothetical protein